MPSVIGRRALIPLHRSMDPDDVMEFHAARLLILLHTCGTGANNKIEGRTKLAKLDFFLRYPKFLQRALEHIALPNGALPGLDRGDVESPMIRYRYGPWDPRYKDFLAFLEGRGLMRKVGTKVEGYALTAKGRKVARELVSRPEFSPIEERAQTMVGGLADWSGTELKDFIYDAFATEVGDAALWEVIS